MTQGKHLRVRRFGGQAMGVILEGDKRKPEPTHFRVYLPGGEVDIARCSDGSYWVHVMANHPETGGFVPGETTPGAIAEARVHNLDKSASETSYGDFDSDRTYDVALRIRAGNHKSESRQR